MPSSSRCSLKESLRGFAFDEATQGDVTAVDFDGGAGNGGCGQGLLDGSAEASGDGFGVQASAEKSHNGRTDKPSKYRR